jgi:glycosyltransferase involved in cell wall biosynthesis
MTFEKGVHILIRAMPHILKKHPNTRLIIAGKNSQKMEPLAEKLGVEEMVDFVGFISDPQRDKLYQVVDAAVFPSLYEPFGIVALEAMAHNCNVIVSDVGGLREVVQHERNGLTTFPNDPESIAWAVDRLFASPEEAAQWRVTALADIDRCFRWEKIAQETIQVYQRVHKERQQTAW